MPLTPTVRVAATPQNGSSKALPKDRGCFQCSRRRIVCDKGEPTCMKCAKKGIECSGLGRIRFAKGVARRGQLKDCKIPVKPGVGEVVADVLPVKVEYEAVRWDDEEKRGKKRRKTSSASDSPLFTLELDPAWLGSPDNCSTSAMQSSSRMSSDDDDDDVEEIHRQDDRLVPFQPTTSQVHQWIAPLSSETRMLFSYFSEAVAPVMVVLDTVPNGYRSMILPMAFEDDVLRRAVGVVAAQHLSRARPEMKGAAEVGRTAIISRLRKEALSCPADQVFNKYTWATLIVLLVGETVTGSADYGFLVHMLLCLSMNIKEGDGDENDEETQFLKAQTNMFKFLGVPFLGEDNGVEAIVESYSSWIGWLAPACNQLPDGSQDRRMMDTIRQCFASASAIYIRRATAEHLSISPLAKSTYNDISQQPIIQSLVDRLSRIPPTSPGAHALVWVCFVAGAETADPVQRQFFVDYMLAIYAKTKFENVAAGVESLQRIWARKGGKRWTQCLSELSNVLVM